MGSMARNIIIVVLVALNIAFGIPSFMYDGPWWARATAYSFFHAGWLHLAVNALAIWTIYRGRLRPWRDLVIPYVIAILVYPLALRPCIGFSNILYAALGLRTPPLRSSWWRQTPVVVFLAVTVAMVFIPRFSATTHIAAFALGMGCASLQRQWLKITADARRYL